MLNKSISKHEASVLVGVELLLPFNLCLFRLGVHFLCCFLFPAHPGVFITVDRAPIEYSRNSVYMECSHEQRGQGFRPGNGDIPTQGPCVMPHRWSDFLPSIC